MAKNNASCYLTFEVINPTIPSDREQLTVEDCEVFVAGYTGRDVDAVRRHIDELAAIGIPAPDSIPSFYHMHADLLTQDQTITVRGSNTTGEVEPVLLRAGGELYLGVGSDHTDRDLERSSIKGSKAACPKPISRQVVRLPADFDWDRVEILSRVDGESYQFGTLRSLRAPTDVLGLLEAASQGCGQNLVMFGGTVPLLSGTFVTGSLWEISLHLPDGTKLHHTYTVGVDPGTACCPTDTDRGI